MRKTNRSFLWIAAEILCVIIVFSLVIFCGGSGFFKGLIEKTSYERDYLEFVRRYSYKYGADENLIFAIIKAESGFKSDARSEKGAVGLMQIMPTTYENDLKYKLKLEKSAGEALVDPETNIICGIYYFMMWYDYFGTVNKALAAYNAGPGTVLRWLGDESLTDAAGELIVEKIPYRETRKYVEKVKRYYTKYVELYGAERVGSRICDRGEILGYAKKYGEIYKVDYNLIMAVTETESSFRECEISSSGALGLMQIKPDTYYVDIAANIGLEDGADKLLCAEFNVMCGAYYLHWLDHYLDGIVTVTAAYSGGINTVRGWLDCDEYSSGGRLIAEKIPEGNVKRYVEKITSFYEKSVLTDGKDEIYCFDFN